MSVYILLSSHPCHSYPEKVVVCTPRYRAASGCFLDRLFKSVLADVERLWQVMEIFGPDSSNNLIADLGNFTSLDPIIYCKLIFYRSSGREKFTKDRRPTKFSEGCSLDSSSRALMNLTSGWLSSKKTLTPFLSSLRLKNTTPKRSAVALRTYRWITP